MLLYHSKSTHPRYNLALEEHLFEAYTDDFLLIYRNEDSVIVGKHQNAYAEANLVFLDEQSIPLIRRFSGGGTVFHDLQNLNFSFITTGKDTRVVDFKKYASPIVDFLRTLNIPAELSERNDILVSGKKVSGHAAHAKSKRALHHGTLLFDSDLKKLSNSLKSSDVHYESRAVKSVRSSVTNVRHYLSEDSTMEHFINRLTDFLCKEFNVGRDFEPTKDDLSSVNQLSENKYGSWDWNFGYSPPFELELLVRLPTGAYHTRITTEHGIIKRVRFGESHTFGDELAGMSGLQFKPDTMRNWLQNKFGMEIAEKIILKMF